MGLVATDDTVWFVDPRTRTVGRFDVALRRTIETLPMGGVPAGIAITASGEVWVTIREP